MDEDHCINCGVTLRFLLSDKDWQRAHCRMCLMANDYRSASRIVEPFPAEVDERAAAVATIERRLKRRLRELSA